jgi:release factor glutamine methyltransferase
VADELLAEISGLVGSKQEAAWIIEHARGRGLEGAAARARILAERRAAGEPLQYVLGSWPFRTIELEVGPAALIPRPETEQLVEVALSRWRDQRPGQGLVRCVDLGTGTGAIGISVAVELSEETAVELYLVDRSAQALDLARKNAERLGVTACFEEGSWYQALDDSLEGRVHLLISNPPYVPDEQRGALDPVLGYEPAEALFAPQGRDGTAGFGDVEAIIGESIRWLAPCGILAVEMGEDQLDAAVRLGEQIGLVDLSCFLDLAGRRRGILAAAP